MLNVESIKNQINEDNVIILMDSLGADFNYQSQDQICFKSICHSSNSYKLYYFINTNSFYCFREGKAFDIISLVQHIKHLDFNQAVSYICSVLHLQVGQIEENKQLDNWAELRRFLPNAEPEPDKLLTYDKSILSLFDHLYPQEWLDYGISADILDKFSIGWYARQACISIPVVLNGQLVGVRGRYTREQDIAKGKYRPICTLDGTVLKFPSSACLYGYDQNKAAISKCKNVILFEAEKSCLKAASKGMNNTLAVFGSNVSKKQIQLLLKLGVNEVTIAFDSDFIDTKGDDFRFFVAKIKKVAKRLTPYFTVFCAYNNQGYDGYKYSPMDFTDDQMKKIFENRVKIS